jgi:hypothetical protein
MEYRNRNHAYLSEGTKCAMGRDGVWQVTQFVSGLICEPSKLRHLYNSSHNYEFQCNKTGRNRSMEKNTYHIVLERAMLRFDGAVLCLFVIVIDNLILIIGVR